MLRKFTEEEKVRLWKLWKSGQSVSDIARVLNRRPCSVHVPLTWLGGVCPRPRVRNAKSLAPAEREEISRGLSSGMSVRSIAEKLVRSPSTVSREVSRNGGRDAYRAASAEAKAKCRAKRPKLCKLVLIPALRRKVEAKLRLQWSPEQIAGWLRDSYPDDPTMQVSHETIYKTLFIQARGALKKELLKQLRTRRVMRRPRRPEGARKSSGAIIDLVSIRERPAEVEDRAIPGHWEGDLIVGANNSHVGTVVERSTRFVKLVRVDGKQADKVAKGIQREMLKLPAELRRSLTWDRGSELAHHKSIAVATDLKIYFADPSSPWQRGTNENTNGLLRQYFPKGMDLSALTQRELDLVALRLNQRPRKTLGFKTPAYALDAFVAATG